MKRVIYIALIGWFFGLFLQLNAQTYQFKHFSSSEGIHFPFIYTIEQDINGYLLIGTGEGLYQFDGFEFRAFLEKDSLAEDFILSSFTDGSGNIWLGHNSGSVTRYDGKHFHPMDLSLFTNSRINGICGGKGEDVWIATQNDGLVKVLNSKKPKSYYKDLKGKLIYDVMYFDNRLILATDEGLIEAIEKSVADDVFDLEYLDNSPFSLSCLSPVWNGKILAGTEDEGLFLIDLNSGSPVVSSIETPFDLSRVKMADVRFDQQGNIWISSLGQSLIQLIPSKEGDFNQMVKYGEDEQISSNVKTSFIDREDNLWIGTFGDGLYKLEDNHFSNFRFNNSESRRYEVHSILTKNDSIWIGTNQNLLLSIDRPNNVIKTFDQSYGLPKDSIAGIYCDNFENLWVSTALSGVYKKSADDSIFHPILINSDRLSLLTTAFTGYEEQVAVGTKNGLFLIDCRTDSITPYSNREGLLHNKIQALYRASDGTLWIGTEGNGLNYLRNGRMGTAQILEGSKLFIVKSIAEDMDGNIWVGTEGDGLIQLGADPLQFSNENGLYSNYCKSIVTDEFNTLWVTHTGAVSRVNLATMSVDVFGQSNGLGLRFSDNCAYRDQEGKIWFGSEVGLTKYDYTRDKTNEIEPVLSITGVNISDVNYPTNQDISLPFGAYKLRFDFIGISHKNPSKVMYQSFLEGHDLEWSELSPDQSVQYNRINPGEYHFRIRAFNADGYGGFTEKSIRLLIDTPFWQKAWFIALVVVALFILVRYVVFRREQFLRQNQEMLQEKLEERTKEVVNQKELLEIKNKDITASIEYAKNIQKAMLPAPDRLASLFREAFVFFKPRDIVSGDFYWTEQFGSTVVVACADCTGHGVPGAFMSLIGGALLKEVCNMKSIHSPEMVLHALDKELKNMVNNNDSEFGIADGMDMSIVEYNLETRILRASGARRPIIIYQNGNRIELKGDRQSIGGSEHQEKSFSVHTLQLNPGDAFYMFSDGLSDQFGGEKGKKLKIRGVLDHLDQIHQKTMQEQSISTRSYFKNWKRHYQQVDDVILLGIRI